MGAAEKVDVNQATWRTVDDGTGLLCVVATDRAGVEFRVWAKTLGGGKKALEQVLRAFGVTP